MDTRIMQQLKLSAEEYKNHTIYIAKLEEDNDRLKRESKSLTLRYYTLAFWVAVLSLALIYESWLKHLLNR